MTISLFNLPELTGCSGQYQYGRFGPDAACHCYLAGYVFDGQQALPLAQLANALLEAIAMGQLAEYIATLDGFFSILLCDGLHWWLISDRVRSRPLFYRASATGWRLSDSAWTLLQQDDQLDPLASEEFLHSGYVTGSDTLVQAIRQSEAASIVCLPLAGSTATSQRYTLFWPSNATSCEQPEADYLAALDQALTAATERLIAVAAGRTILLPLSGGYDSRALAIYLKKSGYRNVECFTFGKQQSFEVQTATVVAASLGFKLHQLVYQPSDWRSLRHCAEFARYRRYIHNLVSVPNVQVYLAIRQLLAEQRVPRDVLVVPGHTGDFVSGGHLPQFSGDADAIALHGAVWRRHFDNDRRPASAALKARLSRQLAALLGDRTDVSAVISCAEAWNYQERQSKFIVNSNRYYDFWQLDWWMPLWDWRFVNVWHRVPLPMRRHKKLWIAFVNQQYQQLTGNVLVPAGKLPAAGWGTRIRQGLNYFYDHNGMFRLVPFRWWLQARLKLNSAAPSVFAYLAAQILAETTHNLSQNHTKNKLKKNCN